MRYRQFLYAVARFRRFVKKHFTDKATVLTLSVVIGILGATAAIIIKNLLHFTTRMLSQAFPAADVNYLYLIFPPIGIFLIPSFSPAGLCPRICLSSSSTAIRVIPAKSCSTVVSVGCSSAMLGTLSKPVTITSSGTRSPFS